jgi:hypothetical protein
MTSVGFHCWVHSRVHLKFGSIVCGHSCWAMPKCSIPGQSLCCLWFGHCLQLLPVQNKKQHYSPWMAWALSQMLEPKNPKVLFCRKSLKIYRHPMVKTEEMKQTAQRLAGDLIGQQCNSWVSLNRSTRILPDLATSPQRCHHLDMLSKARLKEEPCSDTRRTRVP